MWVEGVIIFSPHVGELKLVLSPSAEGRMEVRSTFYHAEGPPEEGWGPERLAEASSGLHPIFQDGENPVV
jgi:hypothetical protein